MYVQVPQGHCPLNDSFCLLFYFLNLFLPATVEHPPDYAHDCWHSLPTKIDPTLSCHFFLLPIFHTHPPNNWQFYCVHTFWRHLEIVGSKFRNLNMYSKRGERKVWGPEGKKNNGWLVADGGYMYNTNPTYLSLINQFHLCPYPISRSRRRPLQHRNQPIK